MIKRAFGVIPAILFAIAALMVGIIVGQQVSGRGLERNDAPDAAEIFNTRDVPNRPPVRGPLEADVFQRIAVRRDTHGRHVIEGARRIDVALYEREDEPFEARVIGSDPLPTVRSFSLSTSPPRICRRPRLAIPTTSRREPG